MIFLIKTIKQVFIYGFCVQILCLTIIPKKTIAQTNLQIAQQKIDALTLLLNEAENKGFEITQEKMTLYTSQLFLNFANWDEANIDFNKDLFSDDKPLPKAIRNNFTAEQLAILLPEFEREEVIKLLEEALNNLTAILTGEKLRKPTTVIDWHQVTIEGNRIQYNGNPVFLQDYIWKPGDSLLTKYYGGLNGTYFIPSYLEKTGNGTIRLKTWKKNELIEDMANKKFGSPFLGQTNLPNYIKNGYPEILQAKTTFTKFDIDHPQARQVHADLFREIVPIFKDTKASELGYMLTNEPHWNTAAGTWDIITPTDYTKKKFVDWLKQKHNNSIDNLQALWSSNPANFQEAVDSFTFPVPYALQGQPEWYDWMTFNQKRVTDWFTFLRDEIQKHDSNAKTHIKLIPSQWAGSNRDHGLNFEALTELSQVIGNDAGAYNSYMWGSTKSWEAKYNFKWSDLSMPYDFFSSVKPNAINYNSEGHFVKKSANANLFLQPSYVKMVYWLAFLQGLDVTEDWVWTRQADGSIPSNREGSHPGTVCQQPQILHEITATVMDVNRFAKEVDAFQNERKPVRVFYSETSAINTVDESNTNTNSKRSNYMNGIFKLYETLYFDGLSLGFATQNIINKQNHNLWNVIVITNTKYITVNELAALQFYLDEGGTIITDSFSLKYDEYGRLHTNKLTSGNGNLTVVNTNDDVAILKQEVDNFLKQNNIKPPVKITEVNLLGVDIKGCVNRSIVLESNRTIASLINISKEAIDVELSLNNGITNFQVVDLLNGTILCNSFTMQPEDVLFLELNEGQACDEICTPLIEHYNKEISGGSYHASDQIISTANITNGSMVSYFSDNILLDANFTIEKGAAFTADVIGCN